MGSGDGGGVKRRPATAETPRGRATEARADTQEKESLRAEVAQLKRANENLEARYNDLMQDHEELRAKYEALQHAISQLAEPTAAATMAVAVRYHAGDTSYEH